MSTFDEVKGAYLEAYTKKVLIAAQKYQTLQIALTGSLEELEHGIVRFISYINKGDQTERRLHNVFSDLQVPYTYSEWINVGSFNMAVIDMKKRPFIVVFRGKQSLADIRGNNRYGAET